MSTITAYRATVRDSESTRYWGTYARAAAAWETLSAVAYDAGMPWEVIIDLDLHTLGTLPAGEVDHLEDDGASTTFRVERIELSSKGNLVDVAA